jgi:hypothetical protein
MDAHLPLDLTTLASCWLITRLDGQKFRFTTATRNQTLDIGDGDGPQIYSAEEGYGRTNIANDSEMSVGNLDIGGVFDNQQLDETELRRGLFDFADVKIFFFNWNDSSDGIIRILRGTFGEIIVTENNIFKTTLRDLTTVFSRTIGEKISKDCRDDLGGPFCLVPVFPDPITGSTAYALGDFVRIPTNPNNNDCQIIVMNMEGVDAATSGPGFVNSGTHTDGTINGTPEIDTAQIPAGGTSTSSMLFDGSTDYFSWADNAVFEMGDNDQTIAFHFRLNAVGVEQTIASQWGETGDDRSWRIFVTSGNVLQAEISADGTSTLDVTLTGTTSLTTGVNYHGHLGRKPNGDWLLTLDGGVEAGPTTPTGNPFNSTEDFRIGAIETGGSAARFFNGWIDAFQWINGFSRWDAAFTAPTGLISVIGVDETTLPWVDFNDTIYEVTTAGTTNACIATPDETKGNTHDQGTAVLTARHSWARAITVNALGADIRREFEVTQLTPNTGHAPGTGPFPATIGFADDYFNGGIVVWETGNNAGIGPKTNMEVRNFIADDGITITQDIELFTDMPFDIQVGDTGYIIPGCNKDFNTCVIKFNNPARFKGEPFVPGADTLATYPNAPTG